MTPKEQKLMTSNYTPAVISKMRKDWSSKELASALDMRVREIESIGDLTFLECGLLVLEFEKDDGLLARELGYSGFSAWMNSGRVKGSRAKRYAARAAMLSMIEINVSADEGSLMSRGNAQVLAKVSKHNRPKLIEAAKTMEKRELLRKIETEFPDEHLEDDSPMRFKPSKSQRKAIDAGIDAAMLLEEAQTREEALEILATEYLEGHRLALEAAAAGKTTIYPSRTNGGSKKAAAQ